MRRFSVQQMATACWSVGAPLAASSSVCLPTRCAFTKTHSRHVQKGKTLRNKSASTERRISKVSSPRKPASTDAEEPKRSPRRGHAKKQQSSGREDPTHHIFPKSQRLFTADECTEQEIAFANSAQIVGIMQQAYDAPTAEEERERILYGASLSNPMWSPGGSANDVTPPPIQTAPRRRLRAFRVKHIERVEIPPVEVPTERQRRGEQFLPTEILRRVMREEPGTSISSRTVTLSCVVRENRKRGQLPTAQTDPTTISQQMHKNGKVNISKTSPGGNRTAKQLPTGVTARDLDDAALVGDAALIVEEQTNHSREQLNAAISDERDSTSIEEADNNGVVDLPKEPTKHATAISRPIPGKTTMLSHTVERPAAEKSNDASKSNQNFPTEAEPTGVPESASTATRTDYGEDDELSPEDAETLSLWKDGTIIPLSTNYVTRCERLDAPFLPFSPHPYAKRIPVVQPIESTAFPPLSGVAMYGSVIAVKVMHNSKAALETAHVAALENRIKGKSSSRRKSSASRAAAAPPQPPIVLDVSNPATPPVITIEFINDDSEMDFGRILFDC